MKKPADGGFFRVVDRAGLAGLLVPATAEGLVQVDLAGELRQAIADQRLLGAEQRTLGIEEGQVAVDTDAVATLGQTVVVLVGGDQVTLGLQLLVVGLARGQAIGDFLEAGLDRFRPNRL